MDNYLNVTPINGRMIVGIYDDGSVTRMLGGKEFYTISDTDVSTSMDNLEVAQNHRKHRGIRPRWAVILSVPEDHDERYSTGDIVLLEQLEWTRAMKYKDPVHGECKVWSIPSDKTLGMKGKADLSDSEKMKINSMYPFVEL